MNNYNRVHVIVVLYISNVATYEYTVWLEPIINKYLYKKIGSVFAFLKGFLMDEIKYA